MDGDVRGRREETKERSMDQPVGTSCSPDQQQRRLPNSSFTAGLFLDVEDFIGTVVDAVNDLTFEGFNSMEEYAVQQLDLKSDETRQALKHGVDSIYSKVQDSLDENLHRWELRCRCRYFDNYPPKPFTEKTTRNAGENCSRGPEIEDGQEETLDTELRSLQGQLVAAHREGVQTRSELTSLEKQLASRREVLSKAIAMEESCDRHVLEETVKSAYLLKDTIQKATVSQESSLLTRPQFKYHFPEQSLEEQIAALKVPDGLVYGDPAIVALLG